MLLVTVSQLIYVTTYLVRHTYRYVCARCQKSSWRLFMGTGVISYAHSWTVGCLLSPQQQPCVLVLCQITQNGAKMPCGSISWSYKNWQGSSGSLHDFSQHLLLLQAPLWQEADVLHVENGSTRVVKTFVTLSSLKKLTFLMFVLCNLILDVEYT